MLEVLTYALAIGSFIGIICGFVAGIHQRSMILSVFVFMGSLLFCSLTVMGFGYLLDLAVRSQGGMKRSSDSPPAAAEGVGQILLPLMLIPLALTGAVLGAVVYNLWQEKH